MKQYLDLLNFILTNGTKKENRTGISTISTFAYPFRHQMSDGFPLLTTKKIKWENIVIENLWFLSGNSKWDFLHKHGITFWDAWNEGDGQLPEAYGEYWRKYPFFYPATDEYAILADTFDQFKAIIDGLKKNRDNRRLALTNWYPPSAYEAKLPPCHLFSIFNTQYDKDGQPRLCLHMTQRSCDVPIGVPFNLSGYGFLLLLVSHLVGIPAGELVLTLVDAHIYLNQIDAVKEQLERTPKVLPILQIDNSLKSLDDLDALIKDGTTEQIMNTFKLVGYDPLGFIKMPIAV